MSKPKVIKDYDKIDPSIISRIKLNYPHGFEKHLISFKNAKKKFVSALPFETENRYFLIKMTSEQAQKIVKADDDYDDQGHLKAEAVSGLEKAAAAKK